MAEAIVADLVKQLGSIAAQQAQQEISLIDGVDDELQKLQQNLEMVQAILNNAEERQLTDAAVKLWFDGLKDAYHMMDDVLDVWNTAKIKSQIQEEEAAEADSNAAALILEKVCSFFPCVLCSLQGPLPHSVCHKIKKLNETLEMILINDRQTYGIDLISQPEVVDRPKTISFVDLSEITGRDDDRDNLVRNLIGMGSQEEMQPRVISLVGMGGVGKSTLAQLAYNHPKVKAHFQMRIWVYVSDPFDNFKVGKAIIESVGGESSEFLEFQSLLRKICDFIGGKRFFLVLDDVWIEDYLKWEPFKLAFKCGAQGSRILVTTRKNSVAEMVRSSCTINLGGLSPDDSWLMFSKIAFSHEDREQHKDLEDLGRQLANKCKGLPLSVKTLGSLMHNKRRTEQWQNILDSGLWQLEDFEKGLLGPLLLSYYDLPSTMKHCFLYCAVFPKNSLLSRDELVIQWMAQGYTESNENMEMEIIAEEYFENLAIRNFFHDFEKDKDDGKIIRCKMHDIVHDFAQLMAKNECFAIDGDTNLEIIFKSVRHLRLSLSEEMQFPECVYLAKKLRTLILHSNRGCYDSMLLSNSFQHFNCLRTLILDCRINKLPDSLGNLIHLRCLLLFGNVEISEFPETICRLYNLKSLSIKDRGSLKKLPPGMGYLINLRHLSLFGNSNIIFPKGIGNLICLRTLSDFNIGGKGDKEGCKLEELKNLIQLRGSLRIHGLGNVVDVDEVENAQLKTKIHLCSLELEFNFVGEREEYREEERSRMGNHVLVLNALEPPPHLESLTISKYMGTTLYLNCMMYLTKLKKLVIRWCPSLEHLPPLGKLPFLESLLIDHAYNLKMVGDEFLGIESKNKKEVIFPKLKFLTFINLYNLEEWIGMGGTREEAEEDETDSGFVTISIMPCLHQLSILRCLKLKSLPNFLCTVPIKELRIINCPILSERCKRGIGAEWLVISHIPNIMINLKYVQGDADEIRS